MGNCQAIDNATLVIQYPCGKVERLYWPVTASDIMKMNPGHYVALLLTTTKFCPSTSTTKNTTATTTTAAATTSDIPVRITRIKLLRPTDTLVLGHVYRLFSAQEVMEGLWAKKHAKMKKKQLDLEGGKKQSAEIEVCEAANRRRMDHIENSSQVIKHERQRLTTISAANTAIAAKSRAWQPSLQSIAETSS